MSHGRQTFVGRSDSCEDVLLTSSKTWGEQMAPHWGGGGKMAAVPLPAAILDDPISVSRGVTSWTPGSDPTGNGNGVIQDGGRKRNCRHLATSTSMGRHLFSQNYCRGLRANDAVKTRATIFYVITRPEPEGTSQTTPKQPGHYSHHNMKLANSESFHWKLCRKALTKLGVAAILFLGIYWALSLLHT